MRPTLALEQKLSLNRREAQMLRMKRLCMAAWASAGVMLLLLGIHLNGMLELGPLVALEALTAGEVLLFATVLRTGLNRRFRDPSLTTAQTLGSTLVLLLTAHHADPQARTMLLMLIPMSFAFSAYRFGTVELLKLSAAIVAMALIEVLASSMMPAATLRLDAALLSVLGMALALTVMAVVGGSMNDMRQNTQFERAMAQQAISKLAEAVIAVDADLKVSFLNQGAARLLGLTHEAGDTHDAVDTHEAGNTHEAGIERTPGAEMPVGEVSSDDEPTLEAGTVAVNGMALDDVIRLEGAYRTSDLIRARRERSAVGLAERRLAPTTARVLDSKGALREVEIHISSISGQRGADIGYVLVLRDVTEHNALLREMEHAATHDELTGLQNRRGFGLQLARLLDQRDRRAPSDDGQHVLMLIDLDQFKIVNDTCGHQAGDDLLCSIASIIKAQFPGAYSLARLGGDEFGVLLCGVAPEAVDRLADELLRAIVDFRFVRNDLPFKVSGSIGLTTFGGDGSVDEVMAQADAACYMAKEMGRKQVRRYSVNAQEVVRHQNDMHWVSRINHALDNDRFVLYGQQIAPVDAARQGESEYELLLRMLDEHDQIVPPDLFLPAAERFNLMPAIDRWVIRSAMQHLSSVRAAGARLPKVAINVSASSLRDDSLALYIADHIHAADLPGELFTFELTESAAVVNFAQASNFIVSVQALGCRVALDDVGTGFCSFAHLQILPVDQIKIDGSFVRSVCVNRLDRVLVESLQRIAQVLGVTTVAEFVDSDQVASALRGIGVDFLQGYGVHRPQPLHEVLRGGAQTTGNDTPVGESGAVESSAIEPSAIEPSAVESSAVEPTALQATASAARLRD